MLTSGRVLTALVAVFAGFWFLAGLSLILVSPFAASFSDDDTAAEERRTMIAGVAAGAGLVAVAGWTAFAGTEHRRNRPRARSWTIATFALWAAVFAGLMVDTATGDALRSDDEDTRGSARGGLVLQGINLAGCLAIITVATRVRPSHTPATDVPGPVGPPEPHPTPAAAPTADELRWVAAAKDGATAGAVVAVVLVAVANPWSLIVPVSVGVVAGFAAVLGAGIGALVAWAVATRSDRARAAPADLAATARLVLWSRLAATWAVAALVALVGDAPAALLLLGTLACSLVWIGSSWKATSAPKTPTSRQS